MKALYAGLLLALLLPPTANAQRTIGLLKEDSSTQQGYVLFGPMTGRRTFLIDKCGKEVHTWTSTSTPAYSCYLLPDGSLLRPQSVVTNAFSGAGGMIERQTWNGTPAWTYTIASPTEIQHHDVYPMPNGDVLAIVWEKHDSTDAFAMGRQRAQFGGEIWSEKIVELEPTGPTTANVVWEWRVWDHLVQALDASLANFAKVPEHPELIDINYFGHGAPTIPDWLHMNAVTYNPQLNEIMVSSYCFDEVWIIDHNTSTAQAASHSGGARGKGGDLLYRWGNPAAYGLGDSSDHQLFCPHNPTWIPAGYPDAGKVIVYNNGVNRPAGSYSSVVVINPPQVTPGNYSYTPLKTYGPAAVDWEYHNVANPTSFFSPVISGAQRLSGGHTLITEGTSGKLFEVDSAGNIVWEYVNPIDNGAMLTQGQQPVNNYVFRATQYDASYPGLAGQMLVSNAPIEGTGSPYNCFFKQAPTAVGEITALASAKFEVMNPASGNDIMIQFGANTSAAHVFLFNTLGQSCGSWTTDFHANAWTKLTVPGTMPQGHYIVHVVLPDGVRYSGTLTHL